MDPKVKILLVESNPSTRLFFSDVFWLHSLDAKFDLFVADGVDSAEEILKDPGKQPDFVFLDLVMQGKGPDGLQKTSPEIGLDFVGRLEKDPAITKTKIIIYSSYPEEKYGALAKERGADMYIYKSDNLPQDILNILDGLHKNHVAGLEQKEPAAAGAK
jgi:CheY-like chemotaxis protein